jgi:hypothetical protein
LAKRRQKWLRTAACGVSARFLFRFPANNSDFDPRWTDDPHDRDDRERGLSRGGRGGLSNPRERQRLDIRDVFTRDLELPRGPERARGRSGVRGSRCRQQRS